MLRFALAAAVTAAAFAGISPAAATTVAVSGGDGARGYQIQAFQPLGQSFLATDTNLLSFGFDFQTFNDTVTGLPGGASVPNSPVTLTIVSGAGLAGSVVATRTATLPLFPLDRALHPYDFDLTGTTLTAGQTYTALLSTGSTRLGVVFGPTINIYNGQQLSGDAYAPGRFYASGSGVPSDCTRLGDCDLNFRFTAITPSAVPEPATWGMMTAGFGVAGSALRRPRRARAAAGS